MFEIIYVETAVRDHPRTEEILRRYPRATAVRCERYGEIFNRRSQRFRLQKRRPALILAEKHGNRILEAPRGYGIGSERNYYFSHMLNCVYDCRYCFLQGMHRSAHLVLFVNYEDFTTEIVRRIEGAQEPGESEEACVPYFFSGYDCDSLALEPLSRFTDTFLEPFEERPGAFLELRTKSVQVGRLLERDPLPNCVVAFSLTPDPIAATLEAGVPSPARRIEALARLQEAGWPIGLRFDPILYCDEFEELYRELFAEVFSALRIDGLHSVSYGPFRLPRDNFKTMHKLYPEERLFAHGLDDSNGVVSYRAAIGERVESFCREELSRYVPGEKLFQCSGDS